MEIFIGLNKVVLSSSIELTKMGMKLRADFVPIPKLSMTATSTLRLFMGKDRADPDHWLGFTGAITLASDATLEMAFAMTGFWPNSFGIPGLNLHNLVLSAKLHAVIPWIGEPLPRFCLNSIGLRGGGLVAVGLTLGGAICIGPIDKCRKHHIHKVAQTGLISASAYVGIDVVTAKFFFYA